MGVVQYRLSPALPERLKDALPSPEDLAGLASDARSAGSFEAHGDAPG
jgi:hypothetical protein